MMRLALVLLIFASGCAPMVWVRPDTPPAEFRQDVAQCRQEAWQEAAWRSWSLPPAFVGHPIYGWPSPLGDPLASRFVDETRLADFCMRAKGYDLVPAPEAPPAA